MSLRVRFTCAAIGIVAAAVLILGVIVEVGYSGRLHDDLDARVVQSADALQNDVSTQSAALRGVLEQQPKGGVANGLVVVAWDGRRATPVSVAAKSLNVQIPSDAWSASAQPSFIDLSAAKPGGGRTSMRFEIVKLDQVSGVGGVQAELIAVGLSSDSIATATRQLTAVLLGGILVAIVLAGLAAFLIARTALRPLRQLIDGVESVALSGDLSTRMPSAMRVRGRSDEIGRLARAFNESLTRIEVMYHALEAVIVKQRRFVSDASHELRTPLTTVSSSLEMLQHFPDMGPPQRTVVVDDALHEARQMARLVDDLLTLARLDSGDRLRRVAFQWDDVLEPSLNAARQLFDPRPISVEVDATLGEGVGDVRGITQLFAILIDNVVVHTPDTAAVSVTVSRMGTAAEEPGAVVITVADTGPGVPEAMLGNILERFVRVDPSRQGEATGLGLAIARAIVAGHGGTLVASAVAPHGLAVTAILPKLSATPDRRRAPRPSKAQE